MRNALVLTLLLTFAHAASAVLIDSGDGSGNLTAPSYGESLFNHVGIRGSLSAVHVGRGIVITANHVGAGNVTFGGVTYPLFPGTETRLQNSDGSYADLLMFQVHPQPNLPTLPIVASRPAWGSFLVVAGHGKNRGAVSWWDPNGQYPPALTGGYAWAGGNSLRWGTNKVEVFPAGTIFGTKAFGSLFDVLGTPEEAQATPGDSGGAAFVLEPGSLYYELAGVIIAIVQYGGQPAGTTYYGQTTYYADLSVYRDDIMDAVAMPEPRGGFFVGLALVVALARLRRR